MEQAQNNAPVTANATPNVTRGEPYVVDLSANAKLHIYVVTGEDGRQTVEQRRFRREGNDWVHTNKSVSTPFNFKTLDALCTAFALLKLQVPDDATSDEVPLYHGALPHQQTANGSNKQQTNPQTAVTNAGANVQTQLNATAPTEGESTVTPEQVYDALVYDIRLAIAGGIARGDADFTVSQIRLAVARVAAQKDGFYWDMLKKREFFAVDDRKEVVSPVFNMLKASDNEIRLKYINKLVTYVGDKYKSDIQKLADAAQKELQDASESLSIQNQFIAFFDTFAIKSQRVAENDTSSMRELLAGAKQIATHPEFGLLLKSATFPENMKYAPVLRMLRDVTKPGGGTFNVAFFRGLVRACLEVLATRNNVARGYVIASRGEKIRRSTHYIADKPQELMNSFDPKTGKFSYNGKAHVHDITDLYIFMLVEETSEEGAVKMVRRAYCKFLRSANDFRLVEQEK